MQSRSLFESGAVHRWGDEMAAGEWQGYSHAARGFHWLTAALVLTMMPMGIAMANADLGDVEATLYHLHRSIGAVILAITPFRLFYRLRHSAPPLPVEMPPLHQLAAHTTHWALYGLLIIQPIIGWIATSAYPAPVLFFWLFDLPPIWSADRPFSEAMFRVHRGLGVLIALLVTVHIAAALYHHFVLKDRVLTRMVRG